MVFLWSIGKVACNPQAFTLIREDYMLYLKHNLNSQAMGAIKQEVNDIENEVAVLIKDMGNSINEAEYFLKKLD